MSAEAYDAIVIGGGPAGLSAAIWLGRYRRRVLVIDAGAPRNEPAWAVHGYPGLVDPSPLELRQRLRHQAQGDGVEMLDGIVDSVTGHKDAFSVHVVDSEPLVSRRLVLAYGLRDRLPAIDGIDELYGTSVFHCPDCDAPSFDGSRIGVFGWDRYGARLALYLRHWSERITLLTHNHPLDLSPGHTRIVRGAGIRIRTEPIARVTGHGGNLTQVEFTSAEPLRLDALFFHLGSEPRCALAQQLGCTLDVDGYVTVDRGQGTSVPGVHAAGDLTGQPHLASIAASDGVRAALAIHRSLLPAEYELNR